MGDQEVVQFDLRRCPIRSGISLRKPHNTDVGAMALQCLSKIPFRNKDAVIGYGVGIETEEHGPPFPNNLRETVDQLPVAGRVAVVAALSFPLPSENANKSDAGQAFLIGLGCFLFTFRHDQRNGSVLQRWHSAGWKVGEIAD